MFGVAAWSLPFAWDKFNLAVGSRSRQMLFSRTHFTSWPFRSTFSLFFPHFLCFLFNSHNLGILLLPFLSCSWISSGVSLYLMLPSLAKFSVVNLWDRYVSLYLTLLVYFVWICSFFYVSIQAISKSHLTKILQALAAASKTVDFRKIVHSFHSYFLLVGDIDSMNL